MLKVIINLFVSALYKG